MLVRDRLVFIHSSDEMYGADRIVLDVLASLSAEERERAEFWLPTDVDHPRRPLCTELNLRGANVRHIDLPIMRRAYKTPWALMGLLWRFGMLFRALCKSRPAMVYLTTSATFLSGPAARLARVPHIVGHKQEMWSASDSRVLAPCARTCHRLIAISAAVRDDLPVRLRMRTAIVLNATSEPASFGGLAGRSSPLIYTVASRWNAWKGHTTLLAAWDRLDRPTKLVVLGDAPPSGESVDVAALASSLRHPETVHIIGGVDDIAPYLEATDVLIVPSDAPEPFGLVAIEAFARARPVIGSAAGGLAEIITDGVDGWTYPRGDVKALAAILQRLGRVDVEAASDRARQTYEARFTAARYASDWRAAVEPPPRRGPTGGGPA